MKTLLLALSLVCCTSVWAGQVSTCQMHSGGNQSEAILKIVDQVAEVRIGGEVLVSCVRDKSTRYSLLIRCGEGEDATYFGTNGSSGKVYTDFGNIAELNNCR